jgi:hypothetical protein
MRTLRYVPMQFIVVFRTPKRFAVVSPIALNAPLRTGTVRKRSNLTFKHLGQHSASKDACKIVLLGTLEWWWGDTTANHVGF